MNKQSITKEPAETSANGAAVGATGANRAGASLPEPSGSVEPERVAASPAFSRAQEEPKLGFHPQFRRVEEGERRILAAAWLDVVTAQRAYSLAFGSIRQHHNLPEGAQVSTETGEITLPPAEPRE